MSYCRWGSDSDVYVYPDCDGGIACCHCALDGGRSHMEPDAVRMVRHLVEHQYAGDKVPEHALARLLKETERVEANRVLDDWILDDPGEHE